VNATEQTDLEPTVEQFRLRAREFFTRHVPLRSPSGALGGWRIGSDSVALFHNLSAEAEAELVAANRRWHRLKTDAGLGSITWEREYGGQGLTVAHDRAVRAEEARFATPSTHELVEISLNLIAPTIRVHGSAEQKARWLAPMRRTDVVACQLFSEPSAGSDLRSLTMRARRAGSSWRLSGQKVWTSGARFADVGLVLARTEDESGRAGGITAFLVALSAPEVDVRPLRQMTGGSSFNEVFLDDVEVPDADRLGAVDGGWEVARTTLGFERASTATAPRLGASWSQIRELVEHAGAPTQPIVRQQLVELYCAIQTLRWSSRRSLARVRAGFQPGPEGSIAKLAWTAQLTMISDLVSGVLGPRLTADSGEWGTFAWAEHVTGAPGFRIAGGSDEIQRSIIGERLLGLPREPSAGGAC
jgi:alkylation response protein AidB-like acyl-CoA dehydrogenase